MKPEHSIRKSDAALAGLQAFNVERIKADAAQCSKAELSALIAGSGLSSRRVSGALAASRKGVDDVAARAKAAEAVGLKVPVANENHAEAPEEMEMNDDSGRTPERVEQVRAEIRRRLGVAEGARESKSVDGGRALVAGGVLPDDFEADGGAPKASG